MSKSTNFIMFILGAAVGSIITWQYVEKKYEQIAQEEIDSVKEVFYKRKGIQTEKDVDKTKEKTNVVEYANWLSERGYTNYSNKEGGTESMTTDKPYIITPEEFSEFDDYEKISLTYYADQILADDCDKIMEDIEVIGGFDSLNRFGEYEDDSVFVRNDKLKCDYEILLDRRTFSKVIGRKPHEVDD